MLNRKQLPLIAKLTGIKFDLNTMLDHCDKHNLLNTNLYTDIQYSANSSHQRFLVSNEYCKTNFFTESDAVLMEGEKYKQLYLTDFDEFSASNNVSLHNTNIFERTKRLNPNNSRYLPEADELNYGIRNKHVSGPINELLDNFSGKITRVRLAYLAPGFDIKPHVDYDPTYITRYHAPLITHVDVIMGFTKNNIDHTYHLPADGSIYFFNSGIKHWVKNNSKVGRIHLIIDTHGQQDLQELVEIQSLTESI